MALVRICEGGIEPLAFRDQPWTAFERRRIRTLLEATPREISRANVELGARLAEATRPLLRWARRRNLRVDFIASHGQTILHAPEDRPPHTLQIGSPAVIAERTGVTTVGDFRSRDQAAGGQGAPLVPLFDYLLFRSRAPAALVNIGGISNVTLVHRNAARCRAFDIGPGNCMLDETVRIATGGELEFDPQGRLARKGRIDLTLSDRFARHPFFRRKPPRSACRSDFVPGFLRQAAGRALRSRPLDVLATATWFTANLVAEAVGPMHVRTVIVSGGGVYNRTLMRHLRDALYPVPVESIERYGWSPLQKEPAAFALLGYRTLRGLPGTLPGCTGAKHPVVLGCITPGRNFPALIRRLRS